VRGRRVRFEALGRTMKSVSGEELKEKKEDSSKEQ
jgi:hypothetical protein